MIQLLENKKNQLIILLGLVFVLYGNTLFHAYTIDDRIVVTHNKLTQEGISALPSIFSHSYLYGYDGREDESYRPLTLSTFAVERSLFDANPTASHAIQILLYALCIIVLYRFMQQLFVDKQAWLPFVITVLFLSHPIHTEVVANVKSRDELLCALFLLLSWKFFIDFSDKQKKRVLVCSALSFFLACLSKDSAVAGIAIFPMLLYFFRGKSVRQSVSVSAFVLLPMLLYFVIRTSVLSSLMIENDISPVANSLALAKNTSEFLSTNFSIFAHYIQLSITPLHQSWDYSIAQWPIVSWTNGNALIGCSIVLFLLGLSSWGIIKRNSIGFGALLFLSMFALTSNFFFLINCTLGERFLFLPVLGIILLVVIFFEGLISTHKRYVQVLISIVVLLFSVKTVARNAKWKNNLSIYSTDVLTCPNSVKTHFNLGTEYIEQGHAAPEREKKEWYELAKKQLLVCKNIYPNYELIYQNIGYVYGELGRLESDSTKALAAYQEGMDLLQDAMLTYHYTDKALVENAQFLKQRVMLYSRSERQKKELILELLRSKKNTATSLEDWKEKAYYHEKLGDLDSALFDYQSIVKNFPHEIYYWKECSRIYFMQKKYSESLNHLEQYIAAFPTDWSAQTNKAMLLEILGKTNEALNLYKRILEQDPKQTRAQQLYEQLKKRLGK